MSNVAFASDRFRGGNSSGSSRMDNQKQGHFALFRSVLNAGWADDYAKLSLWVRILGMAQYRPRRIEFDGVMWDLAAGQCVTQIGVLARRLKDPKGNEKTPKQVRDMLEFFAKEKMITFAGSRHGTVITVINYADYQGDFGVTNEVGNEVTNKHSAVAALGLIGVTKEVINEVEQSKKLVIKNIKHTQTHEVGLPVEEKLTPRQNGTNPRAKGTNPKAAMPPFDRDRFKDTWNCKAEKYGLPKIRSITTTTEKGLSRLWSSYLKQCKELGTQPKEIDAFLNGYIEFGYTPTAWACGANPEGKKFGIDTALTQTKIDQILAEDP